MGYISNDKTELLYDQGIRNIDSTNKIWFDRLLPI